MRLTANKSRDIFPRFSPDGKWIAFSSDREGGLDVYIIPAGGGEVKQLTVHSADDQVLNWARIASRSSSPASAATKTSRASSTRSPSTAACRGTPAPTWDRPAAIRPTGPGSRSIESRSLYWRKHYRGAYQSDVTVMDLALKSFHDLTDYDGPDAWPMWSADGHIYFVSDRDDNAQANIWRVPESGGEATRITDFREGDVRFPPSRATAKRSSSSVTSASSSSTSPPRRSGRLLSRLLPRPRKA